MLLSAQVLFKLIMGLAKVSILALYLRVFAASKYFRWACISLIIVTSVTSVAFIFPTLFQCLPLQAFWDRSIPHQCMNDLGVWLSHALINLVIDILILALPVYHVSRLRLQLRDKLALIFVFVLGGFVCLISIIRSTTFPQSAQPIDDTCIQPLKKSSMPYKALFAMTVKYTDSSSGPFSFQRNVGDR
ncbi:hypothetical protein H113_06980 [Trichophyton rubrum MR1459]|uniref:Rhodopsin domain-containing protein n=3 Tax=Trichophyton TaxID=5550 RepID=F2SGE5_TRIRC|nr:uncharacterized protein TERG_02267 [Trichophyton rubrum CBS 118892]EGD86001.2 hypothetical protein TERG_02267 [Trichophyton rubrum CBS 118892]EZF92194.1 hypothetical protein H113_06980 [Trichophyton rubrum MR1459]EZG03288.1 hypothetical protein H106_06775 [Trichophyton rubrum CBS 735.88]